MTTKDFRKRMLGAGSALRVLALVGAGAAAGGIVAAPASAQDYTSGAIGGTVTDESGTAVSGATVTLTSDAQGFTRTTTTGSAGTFRFASLPTGSYTVTVNAAGQDTFTANGVGVVASQTADLNIGLTTTGNEIIVTGAAVSQDFTGTTTGVAVDLSELVKTVPVSRDLSSVALLAPGTSFGDDGFVSNGQFLPSISGSSVAENAYYLNGLNTTNFDNYLGSVRVPFEFYRTVDVKIGGIPAEFGRATGGIINAVSKSGTNEFTGALHLNWEPNFLRMTANDLQSCSRDDAGEVVCQNSTNRDFDRTENYSAIIEAGGPVIKDQLFVYGLVEFRRNETLRNSRITGLGTERVQTSPFWAVKVDAYPVDNHHLEVTVFNSKNTETRTDFAYSELGNAPTLGAAQSIQENLSGGLNYVGKYTGTLTDFLTVSAAYGVTKDTFETLGIDEGSNEFFFQNGAGISINPVTGLPDEENGVAHAGIFTGQPLSNRDFPYNTKREFFRGDVDLFLTAFGDHHIRAGFDVENNTLNHVAVRNGGANLLASGWLTDEAFNANFGNAGAALILRPGNIVEVSYFNSGGGFDAKNSAFYIQDEWQPFDRLTLNLGVRRDDFKLSKPGGSEYITLKENYAPRLGASYNLWPDESGKLYGSYSQYYLPIASNTAFRQASPELYIRERFFYDGFGADGLPNVTGQVTNNSAYQQTCPFGLTPFSSGFNCSIVGDGTVKPTDASLSSTLEATRTTEYIVGYEHNFNVGGFLDRFTLGVNYTHRNLDISAEDVAVDAAVVAWCEENGISGCDEEWYGFHQYVIINPGHDATFALAGLEGQTLTFSAEDLHYPEASRKYDAVEFTFDRPWDGKWSLQGSYTWSRAKGNSEGFVQSDFEQDDSGVTQDFDQPGFTEYASGFLPTHRTHRIKLFGAYAVTDAFTLGTNVRIESPRRLSCIGMNPNPNYFDPEGEPYSDYGNQYGAAAHFCGTGELVTDSDGVQFHPESSPAPRGEGLTTGWIYNVDLSARYNIEVADRLVTLRADVFNLFNNQAIQGRNEFGDLDTHYDPETEIANGVTPNPNYGVVSSYQTPRYIRLGLDIAF